MAMVHRTPLKWRDPHNTLAIVTFADGRSAYLRLSKAASPALDKLIAGERQAAGELPEGEIASVVRAR